MDFIVVSETFWNPLFIFRNILEMNKTFKIICIPSQLFFIRCTEKYIVTIHFTKNYLNIK